MHKRGSVPSPQTTGFTLIELSIVLVIIGLIVGGILVGQDMIAAAVLRSQTTPIEKYNIAANTFRGKFGYLPGDVPAAAVVQLGFGIVPTRGGMAGRGDGNGVVEGYYWGATTVRGMSASGETTWFWEDLSANSSMISGYFATEGDTTPPVVNTASMSSFLPAAKVGVGNYIYIYASGGKNYFGISDAIQIDTNGAIYGGTGLTVAQAYNLDRKTDDGLPQTGNITAQYINSSITSTALVWAAGGGVSGTADKSATLATATTCYDNAGSGGAVQQYSMTQNNGTGVNCALSFKMQ